MNAAFGPVIVTQFLWLGFLAIWAIVFILQAKRDAARGTQYPDHSNSDS